jgi:hypothetical protein
MYLNGTSTRLISSFPFPSFRSAMSSVGRVAQGVASIFLRPVTVFVGAIAAISTAADQGLAHALDSIPSVADSAARGIGLFADDESRRNTELWEVRARCESDALH